MPDNVETMAYTGQVPWHGLGNPVSNDMTPEEMAKAAEIDWTVSKRRIAYSNGDDSWHTLPGEFALCRDTDNQLLSLVGKGYRPVQNLDAIDFFKKFVEAGQMKMETAGSLKKGKFIWGLAKIDKVLRIGGNADPIEGYLLLSQPHAIGHSLMLQTTAVRVVCWNTFTAALGAGLKGKRGAFRMPHNQNFDDAVKASAEVALGLASQELDEFEAVANELAKAKADDKAVLQYFEAVMGAPKKNPDTGRESRIITALEEAYATGPGAELDTAKGTWFGAFNAVTFCVDHKFGRDRDFTMARSWLGQGGHQKRKALQLALEYSKEQPMAPIVAPKKSKAKVKKEKTTTPAPVADENAA